jgi:hypothetical protein
MRIAAPRPQASPQPVEPAGAAPAGPAALPVSAGPLPPRASAAQPAPAPAPSWSSRLAGVALRVGLVGLTVLGPLLGLAQGAEAREGAPLAGAPARPAVTAPAPASRTAPVVLDASNSQRPGSAAATAPAPRFERLAARGYLLFPVRDLEVLNTLAPRAPDAALSRQRVGAGGFDAVANGGFYFRSGGGLAAAGPVMRGGVLEAQGVEKAAFRGGVARLADGSIVIARQAGRTAEAIQARFGAHAPVREFMGGGALLVEHGRPVPTADLARPAAAGGQQFDQGGRGLAAQQMRRTDHTLLAVRDGQLFLIGARDRSGPQLQADLVSEGFDAVVKFDGGSGSYLRTAQGVRFAQHNPLGFGLRLR